MEHGTRAFIPPAQDRSCISTFAAYIQEVEPQSAVDFCNALLQIRVRRARDEKPASAHCHRALLHQDINAARSP
ncbi:hypothetical protein NL529_32475, partial [Klebsiella pneumoniae]|nr:hypothetical protein [Klebsiella pneumoniae]